MLGINLQHALNLLKIWCDNKYNIQNKTYVNIKSTREQMYERR